MSTTMNHFAKKAMGCVIAFLLAVTMTANVNAEAPSEITNTVNPVIRNPSLPFGGLRTVLYDSLAIQVHFDHERVAAPCRSNTSTIF